MDIRSADVLDWLVEEDDKQHVEDLLYSTYPTICSQGMVGTQWSRVWWV